MNEDELPHSAGVRHGVSTLASRPLPAPRKLKPCTSTTLQNARPRCDNWTTWSSIASRSANTASVSFAEVRWRHAAKCKFCEVNRCLHSQFLRKATAPERVPVSVDNFDSMAMGTTAILFLALLVFRIINAFSVKTFFQPDEYFQSLEPAWLAAFGDGSGAWITWV